jgi:hypothetical protein
MRVSNEKPAGTVPEETMLTDEKEYVLMAQPQVHLHCSS